MNALGRHILIEYYQCDPQILNDPDLVREIIKKAAILTGASIVESVFHTFSPQGVSGVVVITESHLAIHTWPEHRYAAVDLFTCGDKADPWKAYPYIKKRFGSRESTARELKRGAEIFLHKKKVLGEKEEFLWEDFSRQDLPDKRWNYG